jgi:hypothetical protein
VATLVMTCVITAFVRDNEARERRRAIVQTSAEHVEALKGQLIGSMEVLYAIESLLNARTGISRREFRDFVSGPLSRRRELQGLAWDPRVPREARAEWEARAHDDGFRTFQLVEQEKDGRLVPAGRRPEYFPVYFMEHLAPNEPALGFDLSSEHKRRERSSGREIPAWPRRRPIRLVQEPGSQLGFLVLLPVYDGSASTVEQRRTSLRGFAVAVYGLAILSMRRCERRRKGRRLGRRHRCSSGDLPARRGCPGRLAVGHDDRRCRTPVDGSLSADGGDRWVVVLLAGLGLSRRRDRDHRPAVRLSLEPRPAERRTGGVQRRVAG